MRAQCVAAMFRFSSFVFFAFLFLPRSLSFVRRFFLSASSFELLPVLLHSDLLSAHISWAQAKWLSAEKSLFSVRRVEWDRYSTFNERVEATSRYLFIQSVLWERVRILVVFLLLYFIHSIWLVTDWVESEPKLYFYRRRNNMRDEFGM